MSENVASYYWRGRGPLWKVYWLYGVLGSNVLALILLVLMQRGAIDSVWFQIVLLLLAAYTVWIVVVGVALRVQRREADVRAHGQGAHRGVGDQCPPGAGFP